MLFPSAQPFVDRSIGRPWDAPHVKHCKKPAGLEEKRKRCDDRKSLTAKTNHVGTKMGMRCLLGSSLADIDSTSYLQGWDGSKDVPLIITLVGGAVERIVRRNERAGSVQPVDGPGHMHLFFCNKAPSIGVEMYLERVYKYAPCSPVCFLYSYIFLDRLVKKCPDLRLSNQNAHRLLISGVVLAAKFLDDRQYSNVHYAKVGGISTRELNMLEFEMLCQLDFSVFVQPQLLNQYLLYLFESPKGVSFRAQLEFKASQHLNSKSGHMGSIGINAP